MNEIMKLAGKMLLDLLYPLRCPVCGNVVKGDGLACPSCRKKFSYISEPRCKKCSRPLFSETDEYCFDCRRKKFHYIEGFAVFTYDGLIRESVLSFKFRNRPEYAAFYAQEMNLTASGWIAKRGIEALIPVPVYPARERMRGYNQAELLAVALGERTGLPVVQNLLIRRKKTLPQKDLNDRERLANLAHAFSWNGKIDISYKKVLLIDDIYTTGSTVEACTRALMKAGIPEIYFLCICIGKGL